MRKAEIVNVSKEEAIQYLRESLTQLCKCGCLESEHHLKRDEDGDFLLIHCGECDCHKFNPAYELSELFDVK